MSLIIFAILPIPSAKQWEQFFTLVSIASMMLGIFSIWNFYKIGKECPICKYKKMPFLHELEAQNIIKKHGLAIEDTVTGICTQCHYKGIPKRKHSLTGSIIILILGLIYLPISFLLKPIAIIGSLIVIGFGLYGLSTNLFKSNKCPSCKKTSFIPIDSTEAQSLIKE